MKSKHYTIRIIMYILGMFIMTLGISMSVKSNLGAAPVSSIPYTMTCIWGIEMGKATIFFHTALVLLQILILKKDFKIKNLLQIVVGVIFGYFTTFSNYLFLFLPDPQNLVIRLIMILISSFLIALGIFFYLPADIVPLAAEGAIKAISDMTGIAFNKVKIIFDISIVSASLIACLVALHAIGSVGIGTVTAAILVGIILGKINRLFSEKRDRLLK